MEKDMECLPPKLAKRFCAAASCVISTFQPAFLRLRKKHLCEDMNVTLRTSIFHLGEEKRWQGGAGGVAWHAGAPHWQQQSCLSAMIPLSINHFIKTCTPPNTECVLIILFFSSRERLQSFCGQKFLLLFFICFMGCLPWPPTPRHVNLPLKRACLRGWPLADQALPVFPSLSAHRPFISAAPRARLFILSDSD